MTAVADRLDAEGWQPEPDEADADEYDDDPGDQLAPIPPHTIIQGVVEREAVGELIALTRKREQREDALLGRMLPAAPAPDRLAPIPLNPAAYLPPSPRRRPQPTGHTIGLADLGRTEARQAGERIHNALTMLAAEGSQPTGTDLAIAVGNGFVPPEGAPVRRTRGLRALISGHGPAQPPGNAVADWWRMYDNTATAAAGRT
jgi:hypothetical protein